MRKCIRIVSIVCEFADVIHCVSANSQTIDSVRMRKRIPLAFDQRMRDDEPLHDAHIHYDDICIL